MKALILIFLGVLALTAGSNELMYYSFAYSDYNKFLPQCDIYERATQIMVMPAYCTRVGDQEWRYAANVSDQITIYSCVDSSCFNCTPQQTYTNNSCYSASFPFSNINTYWNTYPAKVTGWTSFPKLSGIDMGYRVMIFYLGTVCENVSNITMWRYQRNFCQSTLIGGPMVGSQSNVMNTYKCGANYESYQNSKCNDDLCGNCLQNFDFMSSASVLPSVINMCLASSMLEDSYPTSTNNLCPLLPIRSKNNTFLVSASASVNTSVNLDIAVGTPQVSIVYDITIPPLFGGNLSISSDLINGATLKFIALINSGTNDLHIKDSLVVRPDQVTPTANISLTLLPDLGSLSNAIQLAQQIYVEHNSNSNMYKQSITGLDYFIFYITPPPQSDPVPCHRNVVRTIKSVDNNVIPVTRICVKVSRCPIHRDDCDAVVVKGFNVTQYTSYGQDIVYFDVNTTQLLCQAVESFVGARYLFTSYGGTSCHLSTSTLSTSTPSSTPLSNPAPSSTLTPLLNITQTNNVVYQSQPYFFVLTIVVCMVLVFV